MSGRHAADQTEDLDDLLAAAPVQETGGYRSPLMSRMSGSGKLTLDILREHVPAFQEGRAARTRLNEGDISPQERADLLRTCQRGEIAKERLLLAAIPLIKHLAQREYSRRQNWQSQVTFEDLFQEGTIGLMLGLAKYDPNGGQSSPTNYLGQWILTTMRRNAEAIDNDFGVAFDAAERFRRIRALRSRLHNELGREPTDPEMIQAWEDPAYVGGRKIGRLNKPATPRPGRGLTIAHLQEERTLRSRVGHTSRLAMSGSADPEGPLVEYARPLADQPPLGDAAEAVVERGAHAGLSALIDAAVRDMGLPAAQREVIARRYGLPPHQDEESARDISRSMSLHRERVGRVLEAFAAEMTRPGGYFHKACSALSADDLADLHLDWVPRVLGEYTATAIGHPEVAVPDILRSPLTPRAAIPPPPAESGEGRTGQVRAQFLCPYHNADFVGVYPSRERVPRTRACPRCSQPARLIRLMET